MRAKNIKIIEKESGARFYIRQFQENVIVVVPSIFYIANGFPINTTMYPLSFILSYPFTEHRMRLKEYFFLRQLLSKHPQELKRFLGR